MSESTSPRNSAPEPAPTPPVPAASDSVQLVREAMALIISLIVLALAAYMLYRTFASAGTVLPAPDPQEIDGAQRYADALKAHADAYSRQKDIMLYVLSLFGTVMGYYLGRVPAEANARRAERTAQSAQTELSNAQNRLVNASTDASTAVAAAGRAKQAKAKVEKALQASTRTLRVAKDVLDKTSDPSSNVIRGYSSASAASVNDGSRTLSAEAAEQMQQVRSQIDAVLARIDDTSFDDD